MRGEREDNYEINHSHIEKLKVVDEGVLARSARTLYSSGVGGVGGGVRRRSRRGRGPGGGEQHSRILTCMQRLAEPRAARRTRRA